MNEIKINAIDTIQQENRNLREIGKKRLDIDAIKRQINEWEKHMQYCTNTVCKKAFFCKRSIVHVFAKSCFIKEKNGECGFFIPQTIHPKKKKSRGEK